MMSPKISVNKIEPNPFQSRIFISDKKIAEMAQSIKSQGLLNEILVRQHPKKKGIFNSQPTDDDFEEPLE